MKTIRLSLTLFLLLPLGLFAQTTTPSSTPDFLSMISAIDIRSTVYETDFSSTMTIVSQDPEEGTVTRRIQQYRRDTADLLTMVTLEPEVQRGQAHLRAGDNMWSYDPQSRQFTHISLSEAFQGTTARNSDFRRFTFAEDYRLATYAEGRLGSFQCWIVDLEATTEDITYPFRRIWIDTSSQLLLKTEDYSLSRRLLRTTLYPQYHRLSGHVLPARIIMIDNVTEGRRTQIDITNVSFARLPDYVFTRAYIEQLAR